MIENILEHDIVIIYNKIRLKYVVHTSENMKRR